jgi:tetratricopeptide (TPR) repeat protein
MKKTVPFLALLFMSAVAVAQPASMDSLKKHYLKVYNQAVLYNDVNTAVSALHGFIAIDNNATYKDTLSMLYFSTGAYYSSLALAQEVYKAMPNNTLALARSAECYQNLGDAKSAIEAYEKVCPVLKEPYYYYQLASSQYTLKRIGECEANLQRVIADTNSKRTAVNFTLGDGRVQQVPASAAAYNFLGIIKMEANDLASSKKNLQQALALYPDFLGAKQNLELCESKLKPGGKTPAKPAGTKPKTNG